MKFVIFTPTSSASAIGRVSAMVGGVLAERGHDVVYVAADRTPPTEAALNPTFTSTVSWRDYQQVGRALAGADLVLHQLGDHYDNHAGVIEWLPRTGGALVLHDIYVANLFYGFAAAEPARARATLAQTYGMSLESYFGLAATGRLEEALWPHSLMYEWLEPNADVVVVHSDFASELVGRTRSRPTVTLSLPYTLRGDPSDQADHTPRPRDGRGTVRLVTLGHVNRNKLVDRLIFAIASSRRLRRAIDYHLVGPVAERDRRYLERLAADLGVRFTAHGRASDLDFARELRQADLVACLRMPTYETASASAIETMLAGKPAIVLDHGFYRSLPQDAVLPLPTTDLQSNLRRLLLRAVGGELDLAQLGERARTYAEATFRADTYAEAMVQLAAEAPNGTRRALTREFSDIADWSPDVPGSPGAIFADDMQIFDA